MTENDQVLGVLDIQDPKHPRLKAPSTSDIVPGNIESSSTAQVEASSGDNASAANHDRPSCGQEIEEAKLANGEIHQLETAVVTGAESDEGTEVANMSLPADPEHDEEFQEARVVASPNDERLSVSPQDETPAHRVDGA